MRKNFNSSGCRKIVSIAALACFSLIHVGSAQHLRELADQHDLLIGCQTGWGDFATDNPLNNARRKLIEREFNIHTGGASFSPKNLQPIKGVFSLERTDQIVSAIHAMQGGVKIHAAHLLGRNTYMPGWWVKDTNAASQQKLLESHIDKVVAHYRGKIDIWDVVNESLNAEGHFGRWHWGANMGLKKIGMEPMSNTDDHIPVFIRLAFERAEVNDPESVKIINENQNAALGEKHTEICYEMVEDLKNRSVPIDGVGFQLHLKVDEDGSLLNAKGDTFSINGFKENMKRYETLGVDIYITEMDIQIPDTSESSYELQRKAYFDVVTACLSQPRCRAIMMWGSDDGNSWHADNFPTLFDANRQNKPAYYGFQEALQSFGERKVIKGQNSEP
ncbi:GH35 family endo-1,4-beta-xylanase [Catalinimonas alkaloidigena]|uniref:endo-1,4-beta-xylanase n=1 Tax=Catalinimonas alkaloidigena TaxID=1075417 RepID=UPI002406B460|nr:endo-1,4-beta-xylanase [Catalinimonas alkaloidigena]MDF9795870.1 GH35 family endo-1,4-beta-xylanase [Catalinimonas alkaloidigena]